MNGHTAALFRVPALSLRFYPVWRRNLLVWRKLAAPSMLGNLADPMIYMLGLGYLLGVLAHARAAHLGRDPERAGDAGRRRRGGARVGRLQEHALRPRDHDRRL